jgi:hypothetical protein
MNPFSLIGGLIGGPILKSIFGKKKPKQQETIPAPLPTATRDDAQSEAEKRLELARRRGGAADIVTGAYGAEAPAGGKTVLGS